MFALKHKTLGLCSLNRFQGEEYDYYELSNDDSNIWITSSKKVAEKVRMQKGATGYGSDEPEHNFQPDDLEIVEIEVKMKYVIFQTRQGDKFAVVFPEEFDHLAMISSLKTAYYKSKDNSPVYGLSTLAAGYTDFHSVWGQYNSKLWSTSSDLQIIQNSYKPFDLSMDAKILVVCQLTLLKQKVILKVGGEGAESILSERAERAMKELIDNGYVVAEKFNDFGRMKYTPTDKCFEIKLTQKQIEESGRWSITEPNPKR